MLNSPEQLKKHILLYDELWVPGISTGVNAVDAESEEDEEILASINWLVAKGFIKEPPFKVNSDQIESDEVVDGLKKAYFDAAESLNKTYRTAKSAARHGGAAVFNMDIAVTRAIAYVLWRDRRETAFPVVFPFLDKLAPGSAIAKSQQVLSVVLKRFPNPKPDLPMEDIVAFKRDAETQYKFSRLWHWTHKLATGSGEVRDIEEELDWLLTDYRKHVEQTSKRARYDRLKVWVTVPAETLENLIKLRFGKIAATLFDLRIANITSHDDELKQPGSEIAYVKESIELLSPAN